MTTETPSGDERRSARGETAKKVKAEIQSKLEAGSDPEIRRARRIEQREQRYRAEVQPKLDALEQLAEEAAELQRKTDTMMRRAVSMAEEIQDPITFASMSLKRESTEQENDVHLEVLNLLAPAVERYHDDAKESHQALMDAAIRATVSRKQRGQIRSVVRRLSITPTHLSRLMRERYPKYAQIVQDRHRREKKHRAGAATADEELNATYGV